MQWKMLAAAAAAFMSFGVGEALAGRDLDGIKQRGTLRCGVQGPSNPGFGVPDSQGRWGGFNVEICRAIAITIFGDPNRVEFVPVTTQSRFPALSAGEVDVLSNNTTWTLTRDSNVNRFNFPAIVFYDGQAIMVPRRLNVTSARQLNGATVCVQPGTTTELNLADYFRSTKMTFKPVVIEKLDEVVAAYDSGRCDVYTTDASGLAATRATQLAKPDDHLILPEIISKEPLGPMVRQGDDQWLVVVRWALNAMIEAEEYGITSKNVDEMLKSENPNIKRILGVTPGGGKALGLDEKWAYNIIKQVGNYGESFERNVGMESPLKLARGVNQLWNKGGALYAWPIR